MRGLLLTFFLLFAIAFGYSAEEVKNFFNREGYIVKKEEGFVIIDLPKGKVFVGEKFEVFERGEPIIHPISKEVIGYREKKVGEVEVSKVFDNFSEAKILKDEGIREGDKVRLFTGKVCYEGSEEGFYKLSGIVENLTKGKDCDYTIKELEKGFGVSFKDKPVAFFPFVERKQTVQPAKTLFEDFLYKTKFVRAFEDLPLGADICKFFGEREYAVILFPGKVKLYEISGTNFSEAGSYSLPSGEAVGLVCWKDILLVNMVVDGKASSVLLKSTGDSLVLGRKDIPFIFGKLGDKLVGQEFDDRNLWGKVYTFKYDGEKLSVQEELEVPEGFRVDGALAFGDVLLFVDSNRRLRVYVKGEEVLSEDGFGLSYTSASLPETYEYGEEKYFFYVKPVLYELYEQKIPIIPKNKPSGVFKLIGFTKFSEGELLTIVRRKGIFELKLLKGRKFRESVQALLTTKEGGLFVITGSRGTLPIQNKGEIFFVEINPL